MKMRSTPCGFRPASRAAIICLLAALYNITNGENRTYAASYKLIDELTIDCRIRSGAQHPRWIYRLQYGALRQKIRQLFPANALRRVKIRILILRSIRLCAQDELLACAHRHAGRRH